MIPPGIRIKKQLVFIPTTENFYIKWDSILYEAERKLVELLLVESEKVVAKIEIDINNQLNEKYSTDTSKKREELERRSQNYRRELRKCRRNKWKKIKTKYQKSDRSRIQKVPQTAEQNPNKVKTPSKNTEELKLTSGIENHVNCVSFYENKALKLEKQEQMSIDNMWITDNREERKKKRSYAEVTRNREEVKVNDSGEEKSWSNQQQVNILGNDKFGNVNFSEIYQDLLKDEKSNSSRIVSPPKICVNTSSSCNNSNQAKSINTSVFLDSQDQDILKILEELQFTGEDGTTLHNNISSNCVYESIIEGHFCSDALFNLSRRILTETEIKVLEKGLNFAPIQNKINEPELRTDFNKFCRRMRTKWYFKDEPTKEFSNIQRFLPNLLGRHLMDT